MAHGAREERDFVYRGHRLFAVRRGTGWRVFVHAPGSANPCGDAPTTDDPAGLDRVLLEAKALIDRLGGV